jgi:hypothetical protein
MSHYPWVWPFGVVLFTAFIESHFLQSLCLLRLYLRF